MTPTLPESPPEAPPRRVSIPLPMVADNAAPAHAAPHAHTLGCACCAPPEAARPGAAGAEASVLARLDAFARSEAALVAGTILGAVGWAIALARDTPSGHSAVSTPFYLAVVLLIGWPLLRGAALSFRARALDMNALMSAAVLGACAINEWGEAAALVLLYALAERLEARSHRHARQSIASLLSLAPPRVLARRARGLEEVEASTVRVGDEFTVRAGERVALDGVALGEASLDESPVTGEAMPVEKRAGDLVLAGTLNVGGPFEARATRLSHEGTSARIARMVEEAQASTSPRQQAVERFARFYTPIVFGVAVVVAVAPPLLASAPWQASIYRALALLVAACPCAFVLSGPVATWCALASLSRRGVLVRGGATLEALGRARAFAFDKTGTLTCGAPRVCSVVLLPRATASREEITAIAAGLEARSTHPLARAVREFAREKNIEPSQVLEASEARGLGVSGRVDGVAYRFERLSDEMLQEQDSAIFEAAQAAHGCGHSVALLSIEGEGDERVPLALWSFADEVRPHARESLARLRAMGVREQTVLSGDNEAAVGSAARAVGAGSWKAGLRPEQKLDEVRALEERHGALAMVGDGINDAPALAAASVGVAVGGTEASPGASTSSTCGAGASDIALEAAGVALGRGGLRSLPDAVAMARRHRRVVAGNIALALGIKVGFVLGVLAGVWGEHYLVGGVIADVGSTLLVTLNGLRLLRSPSL